MSVKIPILEFGPDSMLRAGEEIEIDDPVLAERLREYDRTMRELTAATCPTCGGTSVEFNGLGFVRCPDCAKGQTP